MASGFPSSIFSKQAIFQTRKSKPRTPTRSVRCGGLELNSDKHVNDVRFNGQGCKISKASASMLTELVKGKSLDEARKISKDDVFPMIGGQLSAARVKCALLSLSSQDRPLHNTWARCTSLKRNWPTSRRDLPRQFPCTRLPSSVRL